MVITSLGKEVGGRLVVCQPFVIWDDKVNIVIAPSHGKVNIVIAPSHDKEKINCISPVKW